MRFLLALAFVCLACPAFAQEFVVRHREVTVSRSVISAQDHANHLAATGSFTHCGRRGHGYEGLGFSTVSPAAAIRSCCYWGRRVAVEIATAWCPNRRGWVAVVRYQ
jgi:hypothetical protein